MLDVQKTISEPSIWVLQTDKMGDTNNRLAIAEAVSSDVTLVNLRDFGDIEAYIQQTYDVSDVADFQGWPDIFITCEQTSLQVAKDIKVLGDGAVFIAGLQAPDIDSNNFDDPLFSEYFDMQILFAHLASSHQMSVLGTAAKRYLYDFVPSPITQEKLDRATIPNEISMLKEEYGSVYMMTLGSLVHSVEAFGHDDIESSSQEFKIVEHSLRFMMKEVVAAAAENGVAIAVTTSPRTGELFSSIIEEELNGIPHFCHDWKSDRENPYLGMLAASDHLIVTGDSISMVADAIATNKPVHVYEPSRFLHSAQGRLKDSFRQTDLLKPEVRDYMAKVAGYGLVLPLSSIGEPMELRRKGSNPSGLIGRDLMNTWQAFKASYAFVEPVDPESPVAEK